MTFKDQIKYRYLQTIQDRIDVFRDMVAGLTTDSKNDAKGSAGDKHETALAMMHIEQEKLNHKIQEYLDSQAAFTAIDYTKMATKVIPGSLVLANDSYFLVSIALPKVMVQGQTVYGISPQSPLAVALLGKEVGHSFEINGTAYKVYQII